MAKRSVRNGQGQNPVAPKRPNDIILAVLRQPWHVIRGRVGASASRYDGLGAQRRAASEQSDSPPLVLPSNGVLPCGRVHPTPETCVT